MKDAQTALVLEPQQEAALQPMTPMGMIQLALRQNAPVEVLRDLFKLKQEVEADEARKAFHAAMSAFKKAPIRVIKDKENKQYSTAGAAGVKGKKAMYVSLPNLVATVTPHLSDNDLSASWEIEQTNQVKVTCWITHAMGHREGVSMTAAPDPSGAKNAIQQIKSTVTYLKVCTFESVCGLASVDANSDDDGNGAGDKPEMPEQAYVSHMDNIQNAATSDELKRFFAAAYKAAQDAKDQDAMLAFIKAKDNKKMELSQ